MAITEIYVDPSINADTGLGTLISPYGDLEFAIEQTTHDTVNGTRVNIKAGTAEILAASLDTAMSSSSPTIAWVPTITGQIVFQGYTSVAGDGGKGDINGNAGNFSISTNFGQHMAWIDLHMHNTGTAAIIGTTSYCHFFRCEFDTSTNILPVNLGSETSFIDNYVHDFTTAATIYVSVSQTSMCMNNLIIIRSTNGVGFNQPIAGTTQFWNNIIDCGTDGTGIVCRDKCIVMNNSIYANASIRIGISFTSSSSRIGSIIANNLVEGFTRL